jgi:hypothetical protein
MKAVKSKLAQQVLQDPAAAWKLRSWLAARSSLGSLPAVPRDCIVQITIEGSKVH